MAKKDEDQIVETFKLLGLEKEEDRRHFRQLAESISTETKPQYRGYELRNNTASKDQHVELE